MWEALSAGGWGRAQRHPGEQERGQACVCWGEMRKGAQRDEGDESVTVSLCTNADKRADCEGDRGVAGSESLEPEIVLETAFWPPKNQEHCATERVRGSLQITLAKSVL